MKKQLKKLLCATLSLSMVAASVVLPTAVSAEYVPMVEGDTVLNEWKFDFGSADDVAEGYTAVTADRNYVTAGDYGFIGIDGMGYKLGGRLDGFENQEGQYSGTDETLALQAGGGSGLYDGIGSVGEDLYGNAGEDYYPVRFALKVEDETYYRVRATVTTLDTTKPAKASLYTERKHPIYTKKTIGAGETVTSEFTVRVTPIYYQKSDPKGQIADGMVNVSVLGENTALAALEIQQVETAPTLWVVGDSTVTDGNTTLPFWPLQNYTGVGTGLTKYLPSNYAMVNEGEGGLSATDNYHFNMIKSRIKAGDYLYVEYGHNHKNSSSQSYTGEYWKHNYLSSLPKYYDACKAVGATLVVVGPIDRHNDSQYDSATNTWSSTLSGFSQIGEQYVKCLKYGGEDTAAAFIAKWAEIVAEAEANKVGSASTATEKLTSLKAEADAIVSNAVEGGNTVLTDAAFVDLNQPSLDWYTTVTASGTVNGEAVTNNRHLTDYYFQTSKNGSTDGTHPNDTGAENLAYYFFTTADDEEYPVLSPLLANFAEGETHEMPTPVSAEVMNLGWAGQSDVWPRYQAPVAYKYPIVVKDVELNENNEFVNMTAYVQASFSNYALGVVDIYDENDELSRQIVTVEHIDNTNGTGTKVLAFDAVNPPVLAEGETYKAYLWSCDMTEDKLIPEDEGGEMLSSVYTPTDIDTYLLTNEDGDGPEDFDYYGAIYEGDNASSLSGFNNWTLGGSAGATLTLGIDGETKYANVITDGVKGGNANQGSFYVTRALNETIGTSGKYMISADVKYVSGGGMNFRLVRGVTDKAPWGTDSLTAFTVGADGKVTANGTEVGTISGVKFTNVQWILDMDRGIASISVGGDDAVEYEVANYTTTETTITPENFTQFQFELNKAACAIQVSSLAVAELKQTKLPYYDLAVASSNDAWGAVEIAEENDTDLTILSDSDVTMTLEPSKATVTSESAREAVLVEAVYENGSLKSLKTTDLTFTADVKEQTVAVSEGSKVMLWNSLKDMKPLVDAGIVPKLQMPENSIKATAELNTVMTVKATANDGYVFMGWHDFFTNQLVSEDAEYTFRLREDTNLIAKYAKEPGVDDVTSYSVLAENTFVKAETGATTTMKIVNPADANGTPLLKVNNSDATWSCEETGITVDTNGVVTVGEAFTMDGAVEKTVTITCVLNGITRTCNIIFHSYNYTEDFSTVTDSWGFSTSGGVSVSDGVLNLLTNSSANSTSVQEKSLEADIAAASKVTVKFDWKSGVESGKSRNSYFALMDDANNVIFLIYGDGKEGLMYSTSGVDKTSMTTISTFNQNWHTIDLTIDFETQTINGTILDSTGTALVTIKDASIETATNLSKLCATNTYSLAPLSVDNVYFKIY